MKKILNVIIGLLVTVILTACGSSKLEENDLLKHNQIDKYNSSVKYQTTIEIYLKDNKLPSPKLLQEIAQYYRQENPKYKNYFVEFALPNSSMRYVAIAESVDGENKEMEVKYSLGNLAFDEYYLKIFNLKTEDLFSTGKGEGYNLFEFYSEK